MNQHKIELHRPAKFSIPDIIKPYQFKQLLQDIESSKVSTYQTFVLSEVPDIEAYGEPGSLLRKQFYQLIVRLRRRPISKYLDILEQFHINPSTKTLSLLSENNKKMTDKLDSDSIAYSLEEVDDENNDISDYEEADLEDAKLARKLEKVSLKTKPSPRRTFTHFSPTKTPVKTRQIPPTPPRSFTSSVGYPSTQVSSSYFNDFTTSYGIIDHEALILQDGTKENPYITFVDSRFPERNGGMFGYEVTFVSDIQFNNFKRQAYKIRANTTPMDYEAFKMYIPSTDEYTQFANRCTLLKGPSRLFWHRHNSIFEDTVGNFLDAATKSAFQRDTLKVERDETRWNAYCLFVFPVGTILDNNIFSGASKHVKVEQLPVKLTANHKENKFNKQMNEFKLIWTIGVAGEEELADSNVTKKVDYKKLF